MFQRTPLLVAICAPFCTQFGPVVCALAVVASGRKKRTVTAEKESDSTFPRFRRARRAGHSSILASRADGLSLPLPLWPSSLLPSPLAKSLSLPSRSGLLLLLAPSLSALRHNYQHQPRRRHLRPIPPVLPLLTH